MSNRLRKSTVVVGPSGSGKSTLADGLRSYEFADRLVIPKRVITLPLREDSDPVENRNVDPDTFRDEVKRNQINPWWERRLGNNEDDVHMYGFESVDSDDPRERLYLGNNAMLGSGNTSVRELIERSVLVVVTADPEVRGERLEDRLPTMSETERSRRIGDTLDGLGNLEPLEMVTVDTSGESVATSRQLFAEVVLGDNPPSSPVEKIRSTVQELADPYLAPNPQTAG